MPEIAPINLSPTVMPTKQRIAGFAAKYAQPGELMAIEVAGIHTFDEGLDFYKRLSVFDEYLAAIKRSPGDVGRMLVVVGEKETQIYVDPNLPMQGEIRPKELIKAGEPIYQDDIACVRRIEFPGLQLSEPAGLLFLNSIGWRRGMCFDFRALDRQDPPSISEVYESLKVLGGMLISHLMFTERFLLTQEEWAKVIGAGWFPFSFLPTSLWEALSAAIQNGGNVAAIEEKIHQKLFDELPKRMEFWEATETLRPHLEFLKRAAAAYSSGDWISCVSVAVPRIEGLIRQAFSLWGKQQQAIEQFTAAVKKREHSRSLLFPDRLGEYFKSVVYPYIDFQTENPDANRHTVTHGVVSADAITRKHAMTTLMLIDHLIYCLPEKAEAGES